MFGGMMPPFFISIVKRLDKKIHRKICCRLWAGGPEPIKTIKFRSRLVSEKDYCEIE